MENRSNIFFTRDYQGFSEFLNNAKRWKLDFRKLDKGSFKARLAFLDITTVQIVRNQITGVIDQIGEVQDGYRTFVIPAKKLLNTYWMNTKIEQQSLIVFPKNGKFRAVSHGEFDVFAISIQEQHLMEIAKQCNASNLQNNLTDEARVYSMDDESYSVGNKLLHDVFSELNENSEVMDEPEFVFKIKYKIPYLIALFLNNTKLTCIKPIQRKRDKALNACISYISENIYKNVPVSRLTQIAKSSERTIEYAFWERYGISPKTYITYSKINKIKDILSNPENSELVSTVAQKFGFNHMGQFSADYKKLIGELPRQTISNSKI